MAGHAISDFVPPALAVFVAFVVGFASPFEASLILGAIAGAVLAFAGAAFAWKATRHAPWSRRPS